MKLSFRLRTILGVALIEAALLTALLVVGLRYMASNAENEFSRRTEA